MLGCGVLITNLDMTQRETLIESQPLITEARKLCVNLNFPSQNIAYKTTDGFILKQEGGVIFHMRPFGEVKDDLDVEKVVNMENSIYHYMLAICFLKGSENMMFKIGEHEIGFNREAVQLPLITHFDVFAVCKHGLKKWDEQREKERNRYNL